MPMVVKKGERKSQARYPARTGPDNPPLAKISQILTKNMVKM
jgi:hypothetical protein